MPLELAFPPVAERVDDLNNRYRGHGAVSVLSHALEDPQIGPLALVSSFGAESVVLLHLISVLDRGLPVLFIDTEMLFAETLAYQQELARRFGLINLKVLKAAPDQVFAADPDNPLHLYDPDACCHLRKVAPLQRALNGYDAWITGRKRYQGGQRADLAFFEVGNDTRIKINPLALWGRDDLNDYIINNNLPRHPLVAQGYPSIGCKPCTSRVARGEEARAGRWRELGKTECGIHFGTDGKIVRRQP